MSDTKLRCALAYRLDDGPPVLLAKYDHASQYESHGGASPDETALYGGKDKAYAEAVGKVIENDPPSGLATNEKSAWLQPLLAKDSIGFTLNAKTKTRNLTSLWALQTAPITI